MGMHQTVFKKTGGFKFDRFAEDIEFSVRIRKAGFISTLIPDAFVYHKRRTDFSQFYKQVFNFGRGRVLVSNVHPGEIKITHWFPSLFLLGSIFSLVLLFFKPALASILLTAYAGYFLAIGIHSFLVNRSVEVSLLSIPSAAIQLMGYGSGFLQEKVKSYMQK
jgi:cellulose synthase/poly-beta-1,6-N-acetylglucosamine synthase-like glycosyltransferase